MSRRFMFVGERPSKTALIRGWAWRDGRLAAKQLFDALVSIGLDPHAQSYCNLFQSRRDGTYRLLPRIIDHLRDASDKVTIVAMGWRVRARLEEYGILHIAIVHPAARGRIRKKNRYAEHIRCQLGV